MVKNIIANYIGRFWSIFSNIVFIPLYIHFLGMKGYSIISFSLILAGLMAILDSGLTATLSKEFASLDNDLKIKQRLFLTLESIYLLITGIIIIIFLFFSKSIAYHWLNLGDISSYDISRYLNIIGIGVAFQLLSQFYWGGLMGLEQQVKANVFQIGLGMIRNGLVVLPLIFWPNLYTFFIWQTASMIIYAILVRQSVVKSVFKSNAVMNYFRIEKDMISKVWRFAGGIMLISLVAALNTQMDKLSISRLLPLEKLGYYTLAVSLTQGLLILISPIGSAVFPRFTALYSDRQKDKAIDLFYKIFRFSNILILAFAFNMVFNAESLIWVWTNNRQLAAESSPFIPYLVLGIVMLSLQIVPYYVSLANGYTKFNNYLGIISLILTIPGYWIMTKHYGSIGAAIVWGTVQTIVTPIYLYLVNKRFLNKESLMVMLLREVILPASAAAFIAFLFSRVHYFNTFRWGMLFWIGISTFITLIITLVIFVNKSEFLDDLNLFRKNKKALNVI